MADLATEGWELPRVAENESIVQPDPDRPERFIIVDHGDGSWTVVENKKVAGLLFITEEQHDRIFGQAV